MNTDLGKIREQILHDCRTPVAKYINKRISLPVSEVLARLRVPPNVITIFALLVSAIGCYFLITARPFSGFLFFQINSILDGCDGEVARLNSQQTAFGKKLDIYCDYLTSFMVFFGFALGAPSLFVDFFPVVLSWIGLMLVIFIGLMWIVISRFHLLPGNLADFEGECHRGLMHPQNFIDRVTAVFLFISRRDFYLFVLFLLALFRADFLISFFLFLVSLSWFWLSLATISKKQLA